MKQRNVWFVVCAALAVSAAAYYAVSHDHLTNGPVPAESTATAQIEANPHGEPALPPKADLTRSEKSLHTTVAESVHGTFAKFKNCHTVFAALNAWKTTGDCKFYENKPQFQQAYASCLNNAAEASERVAAARKAASECGEESEALKNYYNATKLAARNGDPDAQLCYLQSYFSDSRGNTPYTDADAQEYQTKASEYVDAAIKRGDWRIVYLLTTSQFHAGSGFLHLLDGIGQTQTIYKMDKLMRLGASGNYASALDGNMAALVHPDLKPDAALPKDQVAAADEWAQQTYAQFFSSSPGLTSAPSVCEEHEDLYSPLRGPVH